MSPLKVHFLNVGHGDCTFVEFSSGRLMMVDINNSKTLPGDDVAGLAAARHLSVAQFKSATATGYSWEDYYRNLLVDPADYYDQHFAGRPLFRYVQTHPDMDHMSGLHRFFWQAGVPVENFWDTRHSRTLVQEDFEGSRFDWSDWLVYQMLREGWGPADSRHKVLHRTRDEQGDFWTADGISVLSPTDALVDGCNEAEAYNDVSYVLKISYGGRSLILPGDAESKAWQSMLDHYPRASLRCDILKASHHGRKSGYHEDSVDAMSPYLVVCSVGKKPDTDASAFYAGHGAQVLSTRFNGTLVATVWSDGEVWVDNGKGERVFSLPPLVG